MFSKNRKSAEIGGQELNRLAAGFPKDAMVLELASLRDLLRSREDQAEQPGFEQPGLRTEPLLPGTDIPVHRIAALVMPMANSRLDLCAAETAFPTLTRNQILTAFRHSRACPTLSAEHPADRLMTRIDRMERMLVSDQF